jgi:hypothetical protein
MFTYIDTVIENGVVDNKILQAWNSSNGKERVDFLIVLCSLNRARLKVVLDAVDKNVAEKYKANLRSV